MKAVCVALQIQGLCDQRVNVAQVGEGETPLWVSLAGSWYLSQDSMQTFYAAIFTVKQGGIWFQLFIYESVCLTANMELFSLEWRISVQPWECQMYLCRHEFDFMGKGKGKLACSWTAGQSMKSDLLKLIWAQEKDHVNEALVKT